MWESGGGEGGRVEEVGRGAVSQCNTRKSCITSNMLLCKAISEGVYALVRLHRDSDDFPAYTYSIPCVLAIISVGMLVYGSRILRITIITAAGATAFVVAFVLFDRCSCYVRLGLSGGSLLIAGFVASCAIKIGLFITAFSLVSGGLHLGAMALPLPGSIYTDQLYYLGIACAGLAGAVLSRWKQRLSFVFISSALGGIGISYSLHSLMLLRDISIPHYIFIAIGAIASSGGVCIQRKMCLCSEAGESRRACDDCDGQAQNGTQTQQT